MVHSQSKVLSAKHKSHMTLHASPRHTRTRFHTASPTRNTCLLTAATARLRSYTGTLKSQLPHLYQGQFQINHVIPKLIGNYCSRKEVWITVVSILIPCARIHTYIFITTTPSLTYTIDTGLKSDWSCHFTTSRCISPTLINSARCLSNIFITRQTKVFCYLPAYC